MNWINIPLSFFISSDYRGSDPIDRATWLSLLAFCANAENGGRIQGAAAWKCRKWQQVCGVTMEEVGHHCDLWSWDGDDLVVAHYPLDMEKKVRQKRAAGALGGSAVRSQSPRESTGNPPAPAPAPAPGKTFSQEAQEIVQAYAAAARKGMVGANCEFAIHQSVSEGKGTLEEIRKKTEAIAIIVDALENRQWIPSPSTFFAQERWRNPPESFLPKNWDTAPATASPSPKKRDLWQIEKDIEIIATAISSVTTSESSYEYRDVIEDPEVGSKRLKKFLLPEPKAKLEALKNKKKQLEMELLA